MPAPSAGSRPGRRPMHARVAAAACRLGRVRGRPRVATRRCSTAVGRASPGPSSTAGAAVRRRRRRSSREEQARFGVSAGFVASTIGMVGPVLLRHGTDATAGALPAAAAARRRDLVPAVQRTGRPAATSRTSRRAPSATGDEFVVNGQKVWTSNAHLCDFAILLARTNCRRAEAPRDHVLRRRPAHARHRRPSAAPDHRRRALQRGVPHRRARSGRERGRRDRRAVGAAARTVLAHEASVIGGGNAGRAGTAHDLVALRELDSAAIDPLLRQRLAARVYARADPAAT